MIQHIKVRKGDARPKERAALTRKLRESEAKIDRLYDALEKGTIEQDDMFKRRMNAAEAERDEVYQVVAQAERRVSLSQAIITPKKLEAFSRAMENILRNGNIQFRKACLRLLVGSVDIMDGEIRVSGSQKALLAAAKAGLPDLAGGVPTLAKEWRPHGQKGVNPRPCR